MHDRLIEDLALERVPSREPVLRPPDQVEPDCVEYWLSICLSGPVDHRGGRSEHGALLAALDQRLERGLRDRDSDCLLDVHRSAHAVYELLLGHPLGHSARHERSSWLAEFRSTYEERVLAADVAEISDRLPDAEPASHPAFVRDWFLAEAKERSPLDAAVESYLAERASVEQLARFIQADGYLNYRFYDALVLAQPHFMEAVKNEISHHMWDECGEGTREAAHTMQFSRSLRRLGLELPTIPVWEDWRAYAGHCLYFILGFNRQHYFKALGSLAMPELFDVDRDQAVVRGMERLGFNPQVDFEFFVNHMEGDADHGPDWLDGVVMPIVEVEPAAGIELVIGGALRMLAMRRYNEYLADKLGLFVTPAEQLP